MTVARRRPAGRRRRVTSGRAEGLEFQPSLLTDISKEHDGGLVPADNELPVEVVRVEKNLIALGFFSTTSNRVKEIKEKTLTFARRDGDKLMQARVSILPSAKLGLPTLADQDKYFAFMNVLARRRARDGRIENPVKFQSAELLNELQLSAHGKNFRMIDEWIDRMTLTGIKSAGAVYLAGRKQFASDTFHVFNRWIRAGERLEDGTITDSNWVWLSDWQLENINQSFLLPVDFDEYRKIRNKIARILIPHLQIWLYASEADGAFVKCYDELAALLGVPVRTVQSKVDEQLAPSLDELTAKGYLSEWRSGGEGRAIRRAPRPRREVFPRRAAAEWPIGENVWSSRKKLAQPMLKPLPPGGEDLLAKLLELDVAEDVGRELLTDAGRHAFVRDTLDKWPAYVASRGSKRGGEIANAAAFLVSVLRGGKRIVVPRASEEQRPVASTDTESSLGSIPTSVADPEAKALWSSLFDEISDSLREGGEPSTGTRALVEDWLLPVIPVGRTARRLTLAVPNRTFASFLSGRNRLGDAIRSVVESNGIQLELAVDG